MVEGLFNPVQSSVLDEHQKKTILEKLQNRLNATGNISIRSQKTRSQLSNKEDVVHKMNALIMQTLAKKKIRIATAPSRKSKENRIKEKKLKAETKSGRRKFNLHEI